MPITIVGDEVYYELKKKNKPLDDELRKSNEAWVRFCDIIAWYKSARKLNYKGSIIIFNILYIICKIKM